MKAVLCAAYGPPEVLKLVSIEKPTPSPNQILARIKASTVTYGDCEIRNLTLPAWTRIPMRLIVGYRKPKQLIPGMEFSGVIEVVGTNVKDYKPGDEIFGTTNLAMGGNAEYIAKPAKNIGRKPANVSFEDAATIPVGGINALHFLRMANIQPGQKVLVIGAGGSIGSWGVLLAKYFGGEVTAVDHKRKLDMLRSIGADHVIDYTKEDFSKSGIRYDVIFDLVYQSSFRKCVRSITEGGCYLMANTDPIRMLRGVWVEFWSSKKIKCMLAAETSRDLNYLAQLIETGKIKPVIDRRYTLEQIVEAHHYVEQGLKKGSVIVEVS